MDRRLRTLEQLENDDWGEATYDSYLVRRIRALRRKPIAEFTVEDLRITLGQQMGMVHLTPLALAVLESNPFAEGHFYPGDLLVSVMRIPEPYWSAHRTEAERMAHIAARVTTEIEALDVTGEIKDAISELLDEARWHAA
jgi:RNase adaptor protein for sRNA GlmZ degradation